MRLVLALSKPSLTRMRAVASSSAFDSDARALLQSGFPGTCVRRVRPWTVACECEYEKRMIAHILLHMATTGNTDMHSTIQDLFQYKAWANDELLTALAKLGSASPITPLAIKALSHTYVVDRIFAAHLRRKNHAYASANLSEMPRLEDLSADLRASDREYRRLRVGARSQSASRADRLRIHRRCRRAACHARRCSCM